VLIVPSYTRQLVYRRRHRLTKASEFDAVFANKIRKSSGAITVHIRPNDLSEHRLGLSIGRRVGGAVARGRLKRMIREVFRLNREAFPSPERGTYDILVSARKHDPMTLDEYRDAITGALAAAHKVQMGRDAKQ
jgi:ribonuclease P protein component